MDPYTRHSKTSRSCRKKALTPELFRRVGNRAQSCVPGHPRGHCWSTESSGGTSRANLLPDLLNERLGALPM